MFFLVSITIYLGEKLDSKNLKVILAIIIMFITTIIHEKLILLIVPIVFLLVLGESLKLLLLSGIVSSLLYFIWIYFIYGFNFFDFLQGAGGQLMSAINIPRSILILLFDQRYGIIWFFPLLLLTTFSIQMRSKNILFYTVPYLLVILAFQESHAGFVPPGRYIYPLFPIFMIGVGVYFFNYNRKIIPETFLSGVALLVLAGYIIMPGIIYPHWSIPNGYLHYVFGVTKSVNILLPEFNTSNSVDSFETTIQYFRSLVPATILLFWIIYRLNNIKKRSINN
jgi:hypothetical protein